MSVRLPKALRVLIRQRARLRCEYCLIHERDVLFPHQPDHIIAVKHRGRTQENNLAWSCYVCNALKGTDLASIDVIDEQLVRLFNPRLDEWRDHFQLTNGRIMPVTPIGRVTEYLLQFNNARSVEERLELIRNGHYPG